MERLNIGLLDKLGVVEAKSFTKKLAKRNTLQNYTLKSSNLLREESAGFAVLINLLHSKINTPVEDLMQKVTSLIGYYQLDPIRVLDIILDVFIANVEHYQFFISLLRNFENISQILGFKFRFYTEATQTPVQMFWVAALLVKFELITIESIWNHLSVEDMKDAFKSYVFETRMACQDAGRFEVPKVT